MTCTAGALNTGRISNGIRARDMKPRTMIMKTIVATMYGFLSDALINHISWILGQTRRKQSLCRHAFSALLSRNVR